MNDLELLELRPEGLYCKEGDFYIDPRGSVKNALITHAHSDHARPGHQNYLCSEACKPLLKVRLGDGVRVEGMEFGQSCKIGNSRVSFHPAGHVLGSAQIRIECKGLVWVVSGDYKPQNDQTCESFELVKCNGFISECTFGLPVYRWLPEDLIHKQINEWWAENAELGNASIIFAYSLGKAQRVLAGLDSSIGNIFVHSAVDSFFEHYKKAGVRLPSTQIIGSNSDQTYAGSLIVAPPAVEESNWMKRFRGAKRGFASGWMAIRGSRRRRNLDKGFVLSDHADWKGLIDVIEGTEAEKVRLTHGNGHALSKFLQDKGLDAATLRGAEMRGEGED